MATLRLEYKSKTCIASCTPGEIEIQVGEEAILPLNPKNPLWPESLRATVALPSVRGSQFITYFFDFDEADLNGGPTPDSCDFERPRCFSCCDANRDLINALEERVAALEGEVPPN